MSSKICRCANHPQPCSFFPNGPGNLPYQTRILLSPNPTNLSPRTFSDRQGFPEQLHSPPGVGSAVWVAGSHQLPNFPHEELNPHSFFFDCGISSPGSIPSGASTEYSLSHPLSAMSNDEGEHSGGETTRADWKAIRNENVPGTFDWECNDSLPLGHSCNVDANDPYFDDSAYVSSGSIPTFQVPLEHSLTHGFYNQDRLTEPGIELSRPESIDPSDRQAQDGPWAMNSLGPQSAEYAPSNLNTPTLFIPSNLDQGVDVGQFDFRHLGDFASDHFTFGNDTPYPSHLDLPSGSYQNTPSPDFEGTWDQPGIYWSAPESGCDSTTAQGGSPGLLAPSETISRASSSGSNPRKSNSPDLGGANKSLETAVPVIRWPSPESGDQDRRRDPDENHPRRGRRKGSLPPNKRTKVSETRRIGACMFCALAKVECIGDKKSICARCQKEDESPRLFPNFEICTRARLADYTRLLFPPPLKGHLERAQVDQLIETYDKCFTTNTVQAQFSCDRDYPPLVLTLTEFVPPVGERATIPVITNIVQQGVTFEQRIPATLALPKLEDDLHQKCLDHIKSMAQYHRDNKAVFPMRCSSEISTRVFAAVCKFHRVINTSGNPALLNKAMMLYAGYRFMNTGVRFTHASFSTVKESVKNPPVQDITSRLICRLLNRQLKYAVNDIMRRETSNLLEDLQKELYRKSKSAWATTFCVLLILCICLEEVQTAMEGLVLHSRENLGRVKPDGDEAILVCRRLDDLPFAHMCELFHMAFKSHKISDMSVGKRKKKSDTAGFNPLRGEMPGRSESDGFGKEAVELVSEIRSIVKEFDSQIKVASETPDFGSGAESLDSHLEFTQRNSGRLIATFLRSF